MAISYRSLWIELAKREMMKTELKELAGISGNVLANMGNNKPISMRNLEKVCLTLDITPNEVIEFRKEDK